MQHLITKLRTGGSLDAAGVEEAAAFLLDEAQAIEVKKDFLRAFSAKGESPEEIAHFVQAFLGRAVDPELSADDAPGPMLDVCGTGGDKLNLFNVSTTCTFVLAAAGVAVVKHGNRGITSKSGGADVLEALGVRIDLQPSQFRESVQRTGMGFLFAPMYHPAFKAVAPVRKELAAEGVRTVFNLLGPLLNPAKPEYQVLGVFAPNLPPVFADILTRLGRTRAWAVNGGVDGERFMDEFSTLGPNQVVPTEGGAVGSPFTVDPAELGFAPASLEDLQGGDADVNAGILKAILAGTDTGPKRDLVILNVAAGLVVTGKAADLPAGVAMAQEVIESGKALKKLAEVQALSASFT